MTWKLIKDNAGIIDEADGSFVPVVTGNIAFEAMKTALDLIDVNIVVDNGDGTYTFTPDETNLFSPDAQAIAYIRARAKVDVDVAAENARLRYITAGAGQSAVYILKADDAQKFIDDAYPEVSIASYPFVNAEANALGSDGQTAADGIIAQRDAWLSVAALIEEERLKGKADIDIRLNENTVTNSKNTTIGILDSI